MRKLWTILPLLVLAACVFPRVRGVVTLTDPDTGEQLGVVAFDGDDFYAAGSVTVRAALEDKDTGDVLKSQDGAPLEWTVTEGGAVAFRRKGGLSVSFSKTDPDGAKARLWPTPAPPE